MEEGRGEKYREWEGGKEKGGFFLWFWFGF